MKNYIQDGDAISLLLAADVLSGGVVIAGNIVGVAAVGGSSGETIACKTNGVFELPKNTSEPFSLGVGLYWDAGAGHLTTTAGGNTLVGYAVTAEITAAETGQVKLSPVTT